MHAIFKYFYPKTEKGRERFKELFGLAGRRKPSIFWYNGAGNDLSPIYRITNRRFDYSSEPGRYNNFTPLLEKDPELYLYTDASMPFEDDNIETIKSKTKNGLNRFDFGEEEYEITDVYELLIDSESNLYDDHPFYQFQQGYFEYGPPENDFSLKIAYLVDVVLLHSLKKISILYWKIGNMKFLKEVVLPKGMNIDYILMSNLGGGNVPQAANLILACAGALKLKGLFISLYHIPFRDKKLALNYLKDRMIFINASKNKFTNYFISFNGEWILENENVFTYNLSHLDEILTLKKEDIIRKELFTSAGDTASEKFNLFDYILKNI